MFYYLVFGTLSLVMTAVLYPLLYSRTTWNPYAMWILALSMTTFVMYGLDKFLAKNESIRAPESILHMLAMFGGFPGGWLGMTAFRHKINYRKHPAIWIVLLLSTLGHAALTYYWFGLGR